MVCVCMISRWTLIAHDDADDDDLLSQVYLKKLSNAKVRIEARAGTDQNPVYSYSLMKRVYLEGQVKHVVQKRKVCRACVSSSFMNHHS